MMDPKDKKFSLVIPAQIEKSEDGTGWRIYGLASTNQKDLQGEVVDPKGLDLSPIEKGRGIFNFDHKKGPENVIGIIDKAHQSEKGLFMGGYLFKNHERAKSVHQIMSSLGKSDQGRMGMSIEGVIQERTGKDGKTIKKAKIMSCALTLNPVNTDTYVNFAKSLTGGVEFATNELTVPTEELAKAETFSTNQVAALIKALGVGAGYATQTPAERSGGDALAQEELDKNCGKTYKSNKKKKLKKMSKKMYKAAFIDIIQDLRKLYPEASTSMLFETVKERLNTKFPTLKV